LSVIKKVCIFVPKIKNMETNELLKQKVGELVSKDYRTATVFKKYGIDFCCGGGKSIEDACKKNGVNPDELVQELKKIENASNSTSHNYDEWSLSFLADYIENTHHRYVEENIPILLEFSQKVAKVHGNSNPEVIKINDLFQDCVDELVPHMKKEELILFPYIRNLEKAKKNGEQAPLAPFGTVNNPINMMLHEHEFVGKKFEEIELLSNHYIPPTHACNTYRVLYAKLKEFHEDLLLHIHLENNILFPKAIALES